MFKSGDINHFVQASSFDSLYDDCYVLHSQLIRVPAESEKVQVSNPDFGDAVRTSFLAYVHRVALSTQAAITLVDPSHPVPF